MIISQESFRMAFISLSTDDNWRPSIEKKMIGEARGQTTRVSMFRRFFFPRIDSTLNSYFHLPTSGTMRV